VKERGVSNDEGNVKEVDKVKNEKSTAEWRSLFFLSVCRVVLPTILQPANKHTTTNNNKQLTTKNN
jgi:hypothetical protein